MGRSHMHASSKNCWNQDVRQIVAEFAVDDTLLMHMRLLSSEWHAAVAAAAGHVASLSPFRAAVCPGLVQQATTDATIAMVVRAAMALSGGRAVDLTVFPHLRTVNVIRLFRCMNRVFEGMKFASLCVNLSTLSDVTEFPKLNMAAKNLTLVLPKNLTALEDECFHNGIFDCVDLSLSTLLTRLPKQFIDSAKVGDLRLPACISDLGALSFRAVTLNRLDLSHLSSLTELPSGFMNGAVIQEDLRLPASLKSLGLSSFHSVQARCLDLSRATSLVTVPNAFLEHARVDELLLPSTVSTIGKSCFACATVRRLDLSHLASLTLIPNDFMSGATIDDLRLPATLTALGDRCLIGATLRRVDLSNLVSLPALPSEFMKGATVKEFLVLPSTLTTFGSGCFQRAKIQCLDVSRLAPAVMDFVIGFLKKETEVTQLLLPSICERQIDSSSCAPSASPTACSAPSASPTCLCC